jgi:hypothetical protein
VEHRPHVGLSSREHLLTAAPDPAAGTANQLSGIPQRPLQIGRISEYGDPMAAKRTSSGASGGTGCAVIFGLILLVLHALPLG